MVAVLPVPMIVIVTVAAVVIAVCIYACFSGVVTGRQGAAATTGLGERWGVGDIRELLRVSGRA